MHVEVPVRLHAQLLAAIEHLAHLGTGVLELQLAAVEAADLAVVLVRAERLVDEAQPLEHALERLVVDVLVPDVDDDRHAHDVLDPAQSGDDGGGAHDFAFVIAAWSDWTNASLVSLAPETMSMFALCACSASLRRIGIACVLM